MYCHYETDTSITVNIHITFDTRGKWYTKQQEKRPKYKIES